MSETIKVEKINDVYMKLVADAGTLQELSEFFSFRPAGYQFSLGILKVINRIGSRCYQHPTF